MESLKEGHQRRMEKYRKQYEQRRKFYRLLKETASDILHSENFQKTRHHIQHGTMPVYRHCLDVARQSIQINKALGLGCSERDLIRGALLHDYFLYDWHDRTERITRSCMASIIRVLHLKMPERNII